MSSEQESSTVLHFGVSIKNRTIYFGSTPETDEHGSINAGMFSIKTVNDAIIAIDEMIRDTPHFPITIELCSYGGDVYALLRLIDKISNIPCAVHIIAGGIVASSGAYLLFSGDYRRIYRNTKIMIHTFSGASSGDFFQQKIEVAEGLDTHNKLLAILASNSRLDSKTWEEAIKRDLYLTAEEAYELGLVDEIIDPINKDHIRKEKLKNLEKPVKRNILKQVLNKHKK